MREVRRSELLGSVVTFERFGWLLFEVAPFSLVKKETYDSFPTLFNYWYIKSHQNNNTKLKGRFWSAEDCESTVFLASFVAQGLNSSLTGLQRRFFDSRAAHGRFMKIIFQFKFNYNILHFRLQLCVSNFVVIYIHLMSFFL